MSPLVKYEASLSNDLFSADPTADGSAAIELNGDGGICTLLELLLF